jgi:hypothetical protein
MPCGILDGYCVGFDNRSETQRLRKLGYCIGESITEVHCGGGNPVAADAKTCAYPWFRPKKPLDTRGHLVTSIWGLSLSFEPFEAGCCVPDRTGHIQAISGSSALTSENLSSAD